MLWIKRIIVGMSIAAAVLLVAVGAAWAWATWTAQAALARVVDAHRVEVPVPWPLTPDEGATADAGLPPDMLSDADPTPDFTDAELGLDVQAIARERAVERGHYLLKARYPCGECHGEDFGGGVMIDDPMVGVMEGPNLTGGEGGVTSTYTVADWDRAIRHGLKPDGRVSMMPSVDFFAMSDRELSDIVAVITSMPAVDRTSRPVSLGPLGSVLVATGAFVMSADRLESHDSAHVAEPPSPKDIVAYGGHIAQPCSGCHGSSFVGGPVVGAPPDWPAASNLTPHAEGIAGWSYDDFARAMLEGIGGDGQPLRPPMSEMSKMAREMSEEDLRAIYTYFMSLEPQPTGR